MPRISHEITKLGLESASQYHLPTLLSIAEYIGTHFTKTLGAATISVNVSLTY